MTTPDVAVFSTAPARLLERLRRHLPASLTVLRRLQSARHGIAHSPDSQVLLVLDKDEDDGPFTAAYADFSPAPDGQTFIFSTVETRAQDQSRCKAQLTALVDALAHLQQGQGSRKSILLANLNSEVGALLEPTGRLRPRPTGLHDKWLFDVTRLPTVEQRLPEGLHWGSASLADCETVVSRSNIPRTPQFLSLLPNVVIKKEDETPVVWTFLGESRQTTTGKKKRKEKADWCAGVDGTLISIHCEDAYRRKGLARALVVKLLREKMGQLTGDESDTLAAADVSVTNEASQGLCRSLNARRVSVVSW
ncbi:hypothetical protein L249_3043 [Ophiocordyceps polyrhachis-furcata BCC 54312]|uniref:N-acetyltransferase domain-containing protein n=1 Tax=Ophiocordyceps polyrhachis-furcata BCC 54312 TaxID=1330021 RepID=A0A367LP61_9HYPO|nr:hypothetical protein L249_3043 [Ophiocordyceps polyrhachis-furcata BCC 54312]